VAKVASRPHSQPAVIANHPRRSILGMINSNYGRLRYKYLDFDGICSQLKYIDTHISNISVNNSEEIQRLDELKIELKWIAGVKEQVDFLNANMMRYNILFKISLKNWLLGHSHSDLGNRLETHNHGGSLCW